MPAANAHEGLAQDAAGAATASAGSPTPQEGRWRGPTRGAARWHHHDLPRRSLPCGLGRRTPERFAPVSTPLAFGYIRLNRPDSTRLEALRRSIRAFSSREGLALDLVFADIGVPGTEPTRPGWTALIDVLGQAKAHAVVPPSLGHLSEDPVLRAELRAQITQTGAAICLMPPTASRQCAKKPAG